MASSYRLGGVRRVRELDEKSGQGALAASVAEARATEAEVAAAVARVTRASQRVAVARPVEADAQVFAMADACAARRRHDLANARADEARARASHAGQLEAVDASRAELAAAKAQREVVERHFARWREQQRKIAEGKAEE